MALSSASAPNFLPDDDDVMAPLVYGPQKAPLTAPYVDADTGLTAEDQANLGDFNNSELGQLANPPIVPPGMIDAPAAPMAGPGTGYEDALSKLGTEIGNRPQLPHPKWWQNALGGIAGFGAGWSNAASRTKHPIDIGQMRQEILAPGYGQKLAEWQSRVTPLEQQAQIEGAKQQAWWKNQQLQAQAEYMKEHGAYWKHRAEMEQNQWKIDPKTGTLYNTITGERSAPPPDANSRYATVKAVHPDWPEGMLQYYALNGSLTGYGATLANPDKPSQVLPAGSELVDPATGKKLAYNPRPTSDNSLANELRQARLDEMHDKAFDTIETTKQAQNQVIFKDRQAEVANLLTASGKNTEEELWQDPAFAEKLKAINRKYAPKLQVIQNQYEASIRNRGATAKPWTVDPDTLQYGQPAATATTPPSGAPTAPPKATPAPPAPKTSDHTMKVRLPKDPRLGAYSGKELTGTREQLQGIAGELGLSLPK